MTNKENINFISFNFLGDLDNKEALLVICKLTVQVKNSKVNLDPVWFFIVKNLAFFCQVDSKDNDDDRYKV